MKAGFKNFVYLIALSFLMAPQEVLSQKIDLKTEPKAVVDHYKFVGNHREESMWSALYGAKSGKVYIGLCTHAEAWARIYVCRENS